MNRLSIVMYHYVRLVKGSKVSVRLQKAELLRMKAINVLLALRKKGKNNLMILDVLCEKQCILNLFRFFGKKIIILIDEYDTPLQEAYLNGYWEELVSFMRIVLGLQRTKYFLHWNNLD